MSFQIKELTIKNTKLEEAIINQTKELKLIENNSESLMKVLEENKKKIQVLTNQIHEKGSKDDKIKMMILEKDTEIHNLKNLLKSIKSEHLGKTIYIYNLHIQFTYTIYIYNLYLILKFS